MPARGKVSPHGRCDLPALIVGCIVLRHIWKGVPRQEHTREATSYLFYISPDTPAGGVGWPLGRGWSQPERGGKKKEHGEVTPSCSILPQI